MRSSQHQWLPVTQALPESDVAEAYHTVRINLDGGKEGPQVLLITSANRGEGKTTTAINLAVVSAQAGKRVLLIDADLRNPQVSSRMERVVTEVSLNEILSGGALLKASPSTIPYLSVLPATRAHNAPTLLSTATFGQLIDRVRKEYDLIIIDSPPVLSVSDPLIAAPLVDGVILVVDSKRTSRFLCQRTIMAVEQVGGRVIGGILTKISAKKQYGHTVPSRAPQVQVGQHIQSTN